ncbi:hypothetical protein [Streptomyces sp. CAU 1734]|uniref:hypothetical protein n=1 Tax=Streptomyces sp. CAU 1734 TaxID=3140360 RepID=UPI00326096EE
MPIDTSVANADGAGASHPDPETSGRKPTVRERQHLTDAARNPKGHMPSEASARLVEAMLAEGWVYREDGDGFRLENEEALVFRGSTPWKITQGGRWAALGLRHRRLLAGGGAGTPLLARSDARTMTLVEMHLAEDVDGAVRLTALGGDLVHAYVTGGDSSQP